MTAFSLSLAIGAVLASSTTSIEVRRALCISRSTQTHTKDSYNFKSLATFLGNNAGEDDPCFTSDSGSSAVQHSSPIEQTEMDPSEDNGNPAIQQTELSASFDPTPTATLNYDDSTTQITQMEIDDSADGSKDSSEEVSFKKVTRLGARVQGDMPQWDEANKRFVSPYYDTFDENYRAVIDTVNMASVEGALKYVQAECINASVVTSCERKNSIKYVVFFQMTIVQPLAAMKYFANATDEYKYAVESCPFIPMDGGQCTPNDDGSFPDECNQYIGINEQPKLGFCVGASLKDNEPMALYPHNYWFSFPNSCPQKEILGYILLDDVVGITSMLNPATGKTYANYSEFCEAGGIELDVTIKSGKIISAQSLEFWSNPGDRDANAERIEKLLSAYDELVTSNPETSDGGIMRQLPTVEELKAKNPPCHVNSQVCAHSEFGCKRSYLSQICQLCTSENANCEKRK